MSRRFAYAAAAVVAFTVYANSIPNGFAYDDAAVILKNERVHGLSRWAEVVTSPWWPAGNARDLGLYRPVTSLSFALDWALWNGSPHGFHLTNALAHVAVTLLLLALLLGIFRPAAALAGALLFAVHPVHTEAVANLVGRAEVFAALFALASLLALGPPARPRPPAAPAERWAHAGRLVAAALLYALAALSKEGAIVLPALVFVVDAARGGFADGGRVYLRRRGAAYGSLLLAGLAVLAARRAVLGAVAHAVPASAFVLDASLQTRFLTMIRVWPHYVRLLAAPFDLSADYSPAVILPVREVTPLGILGLALAAALVALAWHARRRDPWLTAGLAWIVVALAPVSNLLFVTGVVLAERSLYLPSAGLGLIAAWAWERAAAVPRARAWAVAYAGLLVLFAGVAASRNPAWKSTASVFNALRRNHPESFMAHWVLAGDLVRRNEWQEAVRWYESAYRIWPHHYLLSVDFAGHLLRVGEYSRAAAVAAPATRLPPPRPAPWQLWGLALYRQGRFEEAAAVGERAPEEVQRSGWFAYVIAAALEAADQSEAAQRWWGRVRSPRPSIEVWVPLYEIGRLQLERGDTGLARTTLSKGVRTAAGDSTGLRFFEQLAREIGDER